MVLEDVFLNQAARRPNIHMTPLGVHSCFVML